jgi:hypothetical protein
MNPLARKALLFALFSLLLGGETAYFGRECAATVQRQRGERAFFWNDHRTSWGHNRAALAWGSNPERLRRKRPIDLQAPSEDPRENLTPALIEIDAARLLVAQDERDCTVEFRKKAIAIDPCSYDARFLLGLLALNPGASGHREQCASMAPGTAR